MWKCKLRLDIYICMVTLELSLKLYMVLVKELQFLIFSITTSLDFLETVRCACYLSLLVIYIGTVKKMNMTITLAG